VKNTVAATAHLAATQPNRLGAPTAGRNVGRSFESAGANRRENAPREIDGCRNRRQPAHAPPVFLQPVEISPCLGRSAQLLRGPARAAAASIRRPRRRPITVETRSDFMNRLPSQYGQLFSSSSNNARNSARARCNRLRTVPIGTAVISAISSYFWSSRSFKTNTVRCSGDNRAKARCASVRLPRARSRHRADCRWTSPPARRPARRAGPVQWSAPLSSFAVG